MPYFDITDMKITVPDCSFTLMPQYSFVPIDKVIPEVKRIIFHDPATIVFWKDGTKTVVKRMKDQEFSKYYGFLAALGKKLYKNNSHLQRMIEQYGVEED